MSNFSGNVRKNAESFKPKLSGGTDAGVGRVVAGVYAGQDAPVVFEKSSPILDTDKAPSSGNRGEAEIGLSGRVDHPDADTKAVYLAQAIARVYRQITADGADLESFSVEQRRTLRDQLIQGVYDGTGQHPSGEADSVSRQNTLAYITGVANLLFGLADEIPNTPTFLTRSASGDVHKSASNVEIHCPHCRSANFVERNTVGGLQKFTCTSCSRGWQQDLSISTFTKSSANPELASLKKQLSDLTERIRTIIAQRAGVDPMAARRGQDTGTRFITKNVGGGNDPQALLKDALEHGTPVQFSGQDPRTAAAKSNGGRFQPRS